MLITRKCGFIDRKDNEDVHNVEDEDADILGLMSTREPVVPCNLGPATLLSSWRQMRSTRKMRQSCLNSSTRYCRNLWVDPPLYKYIFHVFLDMYGTLYGLNLLNATHSLTHVLERVNHGIEILPLYYYYVTFTLNICMVRSNRNCTALY